MSKTIKISAVAAAVAVMFSTTSLMAAATVDQVSESEIRNVRQHSQDKTQNVKVRYIVELEDEPIATYKGGVNGLMATSAVATGDKKLQLASTAAVDYKSYLKTKHKQFVQSLSQVSGAKLFKSFDTLFNGVVVEAAPGQEGALLALPGVKNVFLETDYGLQTDTSLDIVKAVDAWRALGGQSEAGKGIKVAIVDSGIRPENPMFSDGGFSAPEFSAEEQAYLTSNPDYCRMPDGEADFCNNKLIVARSFEPKPSGTRPDEYSSPLGYAAHGTHVAGTAVGNPLEVTFAGNNVTVSGVAPASQLLVYKTHYKQTDGETLATTTALMSAIEAAIGDGADVINNSWGGGPGADPAFSLYGALFKAAEEAGVVVVTAAGNDGKSGAKTIGCPACIESGITVANTMTSHTYGQVMDVDGESFFMTEGSNQLLKSTLELPLISSQLVASDNYDACDEFDTEVSFAGSIALVSRGDCAFTVKAANAEKAGAKAVVVYNDVADGRMTMNMDGVIIPAVFVSLEDGESIIKMLENADDPILARLDPAILRVIEEENLDTVSASSSRGPNGEPNFLKPDIAAPGSYILSAYSPDEGEGSTIGAISGTSMASPHVAGAAALMKQQHPEWDAVQIKTALMSTSKMDGLRKEDLVTAAEPFDVGAGRLDIPSALDAALTFTHGSYADPSCLNVCSFTNTMTNMLTEEGEWTANVITDMDGAQISVSPNVIKLGALGSENDADTAEFNLDIDTTYNSVKGWNFGHVVWTHSSGKVAHLPFAINDSETSDATALKMSVDADSLSSYAPAKATVEFINKLYSSDDFEINITLDDNIELLKGVKPIATVTDGSGNITVSDDKHSITWQGSLKPAAFIFEEFESKDFLDTTSFSTSGIKPFACSGECNEFSVTVAADFIFDGREYSAFTVSDNGFIAVGADAKMDFAHFPLISSLSFFTPNGVIAPLWANYNLAGGATGGGELYIGTVNNTDGDKFHVVEWHNVELNNGTGEQYTFQVVIKEGTDDIRINYIDVPQLPSRYAAGVEPANSGMIGTNFDNIPTGTDIGKGYLIKKLKAGTVSIDFQGFGKDRSNYTANDSVVVDEEQTVTIDVLENDLAESRFSFNAKVTSSTSASEYSAHKGAKIQGRLEASTLKVVTQPKNGSVVVNDDGTIDYTPNSQFSGEDSFTYIVREAAGTTSNETTVSITVNDTIATQPEGNETETENENENEAETAAVSESSKGSSGSFGWLVLLAAPFAIARRRMSK